jgi:MFS family permease
MSFVDRSAYTYLCGASLSYIGTAIVPVALSFAVLDAGYGASGLGLVLAAQTVPTILLLLFAGVAGDRWSRRRIMIGADCFRAVVQGVLATCLIYGCAPLALVVGISALIGIGNAFFQPASGGFLTEIVPKEQLGRTNGLLRTANALAMVIGPAIGGALVATLGSGWGIALDAASFAASALCLWSIQPSRPLAPATRTKPCARRDLVEAFQAIRRTKWLSLILIQYGVLNMLAIGPFNVIVPVVLSQSRPMAAGGAGAWGALLSGIGVGAVVGALACARRQPQNMLLGVEAAAAMLCMPIFLLAAGAPFAVTVAGGVVLAAERQRLAF